MLTLIQAIAGRPWAIRPEIVTHVRGLIAREGIAGLRHLAALKADVHGFDAAAGLRAARGPSTVSTVAVVPVIGTLTQRPGMVASAETRSTVQVAAEIRSAVEDQAVDAVLMEIDSPGGEVYGVPEAWASIRESATVKPVVAFANSIAASAAYYLGSAADEFWATPSGQVGSVGVYALHVDMSKALSDLGEAWDFIIATDSPFKVEGNPAGPLTGEARAYLQRDIDRYMGMFVRDLARGRETSEARVKTRFGGGRMVNPSDAMGAGMIDRVGTFDQAVRRAGELGRERREGKPRAVRQADASELAARARLAGLES